jgi:adenylate cyclase
VGVLATADIFLFDEFRLDRRGEGLSRRDEYGVFVPLSVGQRALDVLSALVEREGQLVTKEEIMAAVWRRSVVDNANLTVQISTLRRVLDQGRPEGSCIQTVAARGYRFVAPVTRVEQASPSPTTSRVTQEDTSVTRRLIAILAADVAGYSRLMGADEEGTLARLKAHRRELVDPKIAEHRGRIVKTTGDGLLVEFGSVVNAVRCAAEVQRGMLDRDRDVADDRRIRFRIGVNLGDIIVDGGDIFGDGVNVAARLEALAEPGGVCVSHTVRDQIHDKLPYVLDDLGEQFVKNIARPIRAYALSPETIVGLPAESVSCVAPRRSRVQPVMISAAAAAALVIAGAAWWVWPAPRSPTAGAPVAASAPQLVAPRLSIVVLPFGNLSNDPDQQYFADGITEDVTTALSRITHIFVISRTTAFTYRNKPHDAKQIGRELGVRYALEGSVRRSGDRVRVNAQLIDAETDGHVWAEQFDHGVVNLFALQNEITGRIAVALNLELSDREAARPTENPDALEYILRARALWPKPEWRDRFPEMINLLERALALDPGSVEALSLLAITLAVRVLEEKTDSAAADLERAERVATQALTAAPRLPAPHQARALVLKAQRRCEQAIPEAETVIALDRNWWYAYFDLAQCKLLTGAIEESIPLMEYAIRLSPRDPQNGIWHNWIGRAHLLQSRTDEAIFWFEKARNFDPRYRAAHSYLASAYALKGETERAAAELAEARKLAPDGRHSSIARLRAVGIWSGGYWGVPKVRALFEACARRGCRRNRGAGAGIGD